MRNVDPPPDLPSYHLFTQPTDPAVLADRSRAWNGDEFSFHDVLDIINPLQHIPVISNIYRYLTGDTIGAIPRIAGDTLYGGPIGFVAGLFGAALKKESGKDVGETMVALATGDDGAGSTPGGTATAVASQPVTDPAASAAQGAANQAAASPIATANQAPPSPSAASQAAGPGGAANQTAAGPVSTPAAPVGVPVSATVIGGPNSLKSVATTTGQSPLAAAQPGATEGDPRAAFLARAEAMRRQYGGSGGATPNNKVVPLQGVALPPKYYSQPPALKVTAPGVPGAASAGGDAPAPAAAATTGQPANPQSADALPSNPPIDISQHMLDALDKYMRLQQQRNSGSQVNVVQ